MMQPITKDQELPAAHTHARVCWDRLVEHCRIGRCTCSLKDGWEIDVLNACYTGRTLVQEYFAAAERVRELSPKLEAGDFDRPLVSDAQP